MAVVAYLAQAGIDEVKLLARELEFEWRFQPEPFAKSADNPVLDGRSSRSANPSPCSSWSRIMRICEGPALARVGCGLSRESPPAVVAASSRCPAMDEDMLAI